MVGLNRQVLQPSSVARRNVMYKTSSQAQRSNGPGGPGRRSSATVRPTQVFCHFIIVS